MKLNKETLKRIIEEELEAVLDESALLKRHMKDRKRELFKKFKEMGKPPRKTYNNLKKHSPHQLASIGQALVDGYPGLHGDLTADQVHGLALRPNPYGGRFHFIFEPDDDLSKPGSGNISIFSEWQGEMEFVNAYPVERLSDELKTLAQTR
jgi:hypothetical protein